MTGDGAEGARIAREAPCSVLIVRDRQAWTELRADTS